MSGNSRFPSLGETITAIFQRRDEVCCHFTEVKPFDEQCQENQRYSKGNNFIERYRQFYGYIMEYSCTGLTAVARAMM
jgi:hypothetical protein